MLVALAALPVWKDNYVQRLSQRLIEQPQCRIPELLPGQARVLAPVPLPHQGEESVMRRPALDSSIRHTSSLYIHERQQCPALKLGDVHGQLPLRTPAQDSVRGTGGDDCLPHTLQALIDPVVGII